VFLGAFQSVFIPNYIGELKSNGNVGSFQSASFIITLGVSLFFIVIAVLFTDIYLDIFFEGHTEDYYALVKKQFYYLVPCIFLWGFSSLIKGLLNIDDEFTYSTLSQIFTPITMILFLVFFQEELGDIVLAMGMLIGSLLSFIFLALIAFNRKIIYLNSPNFKSENIKMLFKQLPAKLSSGVLSGTNKMIDQYFAATLIVGSIAALNYGIKIPMFFISILVMALGSVLLPYFSKKALEDRAKTFRELKKLLFYILIGSSIVVVIMILLSTPTISLVFERNAFTSSDTVIVSGIQKMYLLQIPTYIIGIIMVRFLTAINKNNFMVIAAILTVILNIAFNYILIEKMGVEGLALGTSIVSFINCIVLYLYINHLSKKDV
jgi:putative peptidoglycan lipid II flippase